MVKVDYVEYECNLQLLSAISFIGWDPSAKQADKLYDYSSYGMESTRLNATSHAGPA